MKNKYYKCAVLSLIFAIVTAIQAVFNPIYKLLSDKPYFGTFFGEDALLSISLRNIHILVMLLAGLAVMILAGISFVQFCGISEDEEKSPQFPSKLMTIILIMSVCTAFVSVIGFILGFLIFNFLLAGQVLTLTLPLFVMSIISVFFSIKINIESGEFYSF